MINIHFADDEKFIYKSAEIFEKEFPGKNLFLIDNEKKPLKHLKENEWVKVFDFKKPEVVLNFINESSQNNDQINLFIHFLNYRKARIAFRLKKKLRFKSYWIFYGADLYNRLYLKGDYELYDLPSDTNPIIFKLKRQLRKYYYYLNNWQEEFFVKKFIKDLNFFCFWNNNDFNLVKANYDTAAEFKEFIYDSFSIDKIHIPHGNDKSPPYNCLINHSGSLSGNHLTVLSELNKPHIKSSINKLIVPLNYGNKKIIYKAHEYCENNFPDEYVPLLDFMKKEDYFSLLKSIDIAVFGHKRQEAGGNLTFLLASGVKVYLRKDNNLLDYYRNLGVKIYSLEDDFNDKSILSPLSLEDKRLNYRIIRGKFNEVNVHCMYKDLIANS